MGPTAGWCLTCYINARFVWVTAKGLEDIMVNAKLLNVFKERLDKYLKNRSPWDYCISKPHEAQLIDEKTHGLSAYLKEIGLFYS